jgi:DNA-binding transcriptional LysR family regulator
MDIRALRHVVALARTLNFTNAAEELGISQPVLSRSIQAIERRENVRLFDRDKRGVRITPVGREFADRAAVLLEELEELGSSLRRGARGEAGELVFGVAPLPAKALLSQVITDLSANSPELTFCAHVRNPDALLGLLEAGKIQFFVSAEAFFPEPPNLRSEFLGFFPVAHLVRAGHPLLRTKESVEGPWPLLMTARVDEQPNIPVSLKPHISKVRRVVVEDNAILAQIAESSDAIWATSPFVALDALEDGRLSEVPPSPDETPAQVRIAFYSLLRRSISPAALRFKNRMRSEIRSLWRRMDERRQH